MRVIRFRLAEEKQMRACLQHAAPSKFLQISEAQSLDNPFRVAAFLMMSSSFGEDSKPDFGHGIGSRRRKQAKSIIADRPGMIRLHPGVECRQRPQDCCFASAPAVSSSTSSAPLPNCHLAAPQPYTFVIARLTLHRDLAGPRETVSSLRGRPNMLNVDRLSRNSHGPPVELTEPFVIVQLRAFRCHVSTSSAWRRRRVSSTSAGVACCEMARARRRSRVG